MSQLVPRQELPSELLYKILAHTLAHSVHTVIVSSQDIAWHMRAHHTLSSVCYSFREIMKGISSKAFQYVVAKGAEEAPTLAQHVQRHFQSLRALGAAIRDSAVPGAFSLESLDSFAPQLVQGYSLYVAIVYLRTQALRSTPEIYQSTSMTIFGAVITLSKVLYSRIAPREIAVMLKHATEDEAALSHIGLLVVKHSILLAGCVEALTAECDPADEEAVLRRDGSKDRAARLIQSLAAADTEFLALFRRTTPPLPCCTAVWLSQLPDVYTTLRCVHEVLSKQPGVVSDDAAGSLRDLVERWTPPPPPPPEPTADPLSVAVTEPGPIPS
ncbi:hypothetical protein B0H15DRAFT_846708 [Mycena belliarum]|uniref:Uncharacterized protein n=1 Tax=Mycena belliarum TaxID=1033014 RepID=A0AAD6XMP7_9AGAR|nr:hypothetical protein B0H15DRAFT_846708 [Mycena belliae]